MWSGPGKVIPVENEEDGFWLPTWAYEHRISGREWALSYEEDELSHLPEDLKIFRTDELVRRKDLPDQWRCDGCGAEFFWERNHDDEQATCPSCASPDTELINEHEDSGYSPPKYLQLSDEVREQEIILTVGELHELLYSFDWIQILRESVESRPGSWGVQKGKEMNAVQEWRNASDTLLSPIWKRLFQKLYKQELSEEVEDE